jgi:signal transduction histidine kinase
MVQRLLTMPYERFGARVLPMCVAAGLCVVMAHALVTLVWLSRYLRLPSSDYLPLAAMTATAFAVVVLPSLFMSRGELRTALSWSGDGRTEARAREVWETLVRVPYAAARRGVAIGCVALIPYTIAVLAVLHEPAYSAAAIYVVVAAYILGGGLVMALETELALRPMLQDVATHLPANFQPTVRTWRLQTKALALLPVVAFVGTLTAGGFANLVSSGPERLAVAVGIALATVGASAVLFFIVIRATLDPLDHMIEATRRVREGDWSARVPLVTADDLGRLAHSFNEMLDALRRNEHELRASRSRIVTAADAERRRMERDLHDGAQQHLLLVNLKLGMAESRIAADPCTAPATLGEIRSDVARALSALRDLAHGIYPPVLESEGLSSALREAAQRITVATELKFDGLCRYPLELEAAVYFCCLEALQNAAKHAGEGATATVRLAQRGDLLEIEVSDDGQGCDDTSLDEGFGIQSMRDRVGALGGTLELHTALGSGVQLTAAVPLNTASPACR